MEEKKSVTIRTAITKLIAKFEILINEKKKKTDDYLEFLEQLNEKKESLKKFNSKIEAAIWIIIKTVLLAF